MFAVAEKTLNKVKVDLIIYQNESGRSVVRNDHLGIYVKPNRHTWASHTDTIGIGPPPKKFWIENPPPQKVVSRAK